MSGNKETESLPASPRRFRKRPVVIEAMPFDGSHASAQGILDWLNAHNPNYLEGDSSTWTVSHYYGALTISTLEGEMLAGKGDWIIKGVQGEFYPCKPDIFEQTYEAVDV